MDIGEPTVLVKLPRAGLTGEGRTQFSQVYGVRDGQRKKRHEVCAAVDSNSLNIYEVVNGRNIASWPIPPDSTFASQPYSERVSANAKSFTRRSWCVVNRRGQFFLQLYEQTRKHGETTSSTTAHTLRDSSPVTKLVAVDTTERDAIVIQENGMVTGATGDGTRISYQSILADSLISIKILAAQCMSLREARSSVLKSRLDLASTLPEGAILISGVYQNQSKDLRLGLWALLPITGTSDAAKVEPLVSHSLKQQLSQDYPKKLTAEFISFTKLEISGANRTTTFDLTTIVPRILSDHTHTVTGTSSSLEVIRDIYLAVASFSLHLYNKKFDSILATSTPDVSTLKRKRDGEGGVRLSLVAYFSQLKRALAFNGSHLLTIEISGKDTEQNPLKNGSLLIGNILRGNSTLPKSKDSPECTISFGRVRQEKPVPNWPLISQELDALAEKGDAKGFEELFVQTMGLQKPQDLHINKIPETQVDFLLSKIFAITASSYDQSRPQLKLALLSTELLKWCVKAGFTDEYRLVQVLDRSPNTIGPGSVAQCLLEADPKLSLVEYYIQYSPFLLPETLTFLVKEMVLKALNQSNQDEEVQTAKDADDEGNTASSQQLISMGDRDNELKSSTPATICLAFTLKRLAFTGHATVSTQLRSLDQRTILGLIQYLRQQLFLGGFSRLSQAQDYPSPPPSETEEDHVSTNPNPQISLSGIITLLNACIDAVGPVGILGSEAHEAFIRKMVPELLSEISSASQAVQESTFLQGLVRETLRYVESVEGQPFSARAKAEKKEKSGLVEKGRIVTIYAEPETAAGGVLPASVLPLSLKAEEDIGREKIRKGGQAHRRSAREIGMLKDRLRAPYSFERLVL
ncbi:hypothetical protein LTR64_003743 [Lithohypha guttulata]|uniref:uncharacterized protein n=1 Tax=Lithohypha guttulata TaxID=1690604 RepID=UPI002DE19A6B|nr:hypothetical protein LTR51_000037 [Lithohypha guttulata]